MAAPAPSGFEEMYDAPVVFAQHADEPLGVAPPDGLLAPLRRAVFVATTAGLPALDGGEGGGWYAASSDNTVAFVHPIPVGSSIAIEIGRIVRMTRHGNVEGRRGGIPKPAELPDPLAPSDVDDDVAEGLYAALTASDEAARRLAVAIDWLDVAWRNTDSITDDLRILALHAGVEVLLMEGARANYRKLARRYDEWLGSEVAEPRTWTINGEPWTEAFSDAAWWLIHFTWLRNAIAHGDPRTKDDYRYGDGRLHLVLAEHALRRLILIGAGRLTGIEDLLEDRLTRQIGRATGEWLRSRHAEGETPGAQAASSSSPRPRPSGQGELDPLGVEGVAPPHPGEGQRGPRPALRGLGRPGRPRFRGSAYGPAWMIYRCAAACPAGLPAPAGERCRSDGSARGRGAFLRLGP